IARRKEKRDAWAFGIARGRKIPQPRQAHCAVRDAQSVKYPEKCNESENDQPEEVHVELVRKLASGYSTSQWRGPWQSSAGGAQAILSAAVSKNMAGKLGPSLLARKPVPGVPPVSSEQANPMARFPAKFWTPASF